MQELILSYDGNNKGNYDLFLNSRFIGELMTDEDTVIHIVESFNK
jgi:hypothetical protein